MIHKIFFASCITCGLMFCKPIKEDKYLFSQDIKEVQEKLSDEETKTNNVPRLFVVNVPQNIEEIEDVNERKQVFFKMMLPLILKVNEEILAERQTIIKAQETFEKNNKISSQQKKEIKQLAQKYKVEGKDYKEKIEKLLKKVYPIPPSLAIAQAAAESGWGTSRFAKKGNALFGEWTYDGIGLVPSDRAKNAKHKVKAFNTMLDAVRSYALLINKNSSYRYIHEKRQESQEKGTKLNGIILAEGLRAYSELGRKYVKTVQSIIKNNQLTKLDDAILIK